MPHFVPGCGLITISQMFYEDCFKMFPIMLAFCSMLSETHYYASIINLLGQLRYNVTSVPKEMQELAIEKRNILKMKNYVITFQFISIILFIIYIAQLQFSTYICT